MSMIRPIFLAFAFMVLGAVAVPLPAQQAASAKAQSGDPLERTTPAWFDEAKLGIFIHWNAASIPAYAPVTSLEALRADQAHASKPSLAGVYRKLPYAEMYQTALGIPGSATARYHAEHYGALSYDDFVAQFRDRMIPGWDPGAWATLFARAGARYVVVTTKTEDGFLLWPSAHPNPHKRRWQSTRDAVGDLASAIRNEGLRFATYYSGGSDWTFGGLQPGSERPRSEEYRLYVDKHWRELIERYRPDILWNDYAYPGASVPGIDAREARLDLTFKRHVEDLFRFYLAKVPDGVINNRFDLAAQSSGKLYADFVTPEYSTDPEVGITGRAKGLALKWEACRGIGTSFGYNAYEDENSYLSTAELIHMFVDIVARGGNLLLNVGPLATGEIPWLQAQRLLDLGWWLSTNGRAIYGTRPWVRASGIAGDGRQVRFTSSNDAVYAIVLGTPKSKVVELDLRLANDTEVGLEGWQGELAWKATPAGVAIELPIMPDDRPAVSLRFSPRNGVQPL